MLLKHFWSALKKQLMREIGKFACGFWEGRFSADFGRRVYRKKNVVSENKNENVELIVNDAD